MDLKIARASMVKSQIRPNRVDDEFVLAALSATPREAFLPKALHGICYVDEDLPLGDGRYMMEPLVLARLLQAAAVQPDDVALVIGCSTGYSAAVLSRMAGAVVALESDPALAKRAGEIISRLEIDTVAVVEGDPHAGYPKQAPFDVILFDGAIDRIPPAVAGQLADGGRLVAVVRDGMGLGRGTVMRNVHGVKGTREIFDANIPFLPGFEPDTAFEF